MSLLIDSKCSWCLKQFNVSDVQPVLLPCQHHLCLEHADANRHRYSSDRKCPECGMSYEKDLGIDRNLIKYLNVMLQQAQQDLAEVKVPDEKSSVDLSRIVNLYLNNRQDKMYVMMLGDAGVGKSSLMHRFQQRDNFRKDLPSATCGVDMGFSEIGVAGQAVPIVIQDTAGQERYRSINRRHYQKADAILLVFDLSRLETFSKIPEWLLEIEEHARDDVVVMLVGAKADLRKEVDYDCVSKFASDMGMHYLETSAFEFHNVDLAFETIVKVVMTIKTQHMTTSSASGATDGGATIAVELQPNNQAKKGWCC
eukprot:TRINITY_DN7643_c0_g1_i1.p1 TRINITY_DN7643_c0_g1~~TRINITY_DN7643_c0_g1_i1.p1  ORF type:complete len:311 (+),score=65.73 TRINITY_DN7643_c0_g1_i1:605-1537(+)